MKKFVIIALGLLTATAITTNAAEKKELTEEQKKVRQEILDKYDTNKNGKLDPEEREKISAEDKEKLAKAGLGGGKKKEEKK